MQYWLSRLKTWLHQVWQTIDASGTDGEIFWGLLKILGLLGLAIVVVLMFSRGKSKEMM